MLLLKTFVCVSLMYRGEGGFVEGMTPPFKEFKKKIPQKSFVYRYGTQHWRLKCPKPSAGARLRGVVVTQNSNTLHLKEIQYITLKYSTLHCSTVQYITMQLNTVHYSAVQLCKVHYCTVPTIQLL